MPGVYYSTVLDAPIERVWDSIRDFNALADWHPLIVDCHIEENQPSDRVGCVRNFRLEDGANFRERLLSLNDFKKTFSYCIEECPLPLENYVATVKLSPVTDGNRTFVSWSSTFQCPPDAEQELSELVEDGVYRAGLEAIRKILDQGQTTS